MERTVGHFPPEILVLFKVLVSSRSVTDDAETEERNLIEVAHLGNGSRFHIHSQSFREVMLDFVQFAAVSNKLAAFKVLSIILSTP